MIDYALILQKRFPGSQWSLNGDSYDGLTWLDQTEKPSRNELDSLWDEVEKEITVEKLAEQKKYEDAVSKLHSLGLDIDDLNLLLG